MSDDSGAGNEPTSSPTTPKELRDLISREKRDARPVASWNIPFHESPKAARSRASRKRTPRSPRKSSQQSPRNPPLQAQQQPPQLDSILKSSRITPVEEGRERSLRKRAEKKRQADEKLALYGDKPVGDNGAITPADTALASSSRAVRADSADAVLDEDDGSQSTADACGVLSRRSSRGNLEEDESAPTRQDLAALISSGPSNKPIKRPNLKLFTTSQQSPHVQKAGDGGAQVATPLSAATISPQSSTFCFCFFVHYFSERSV